MTEDEKALIGCQALFRVGSLIHHCISFGRWSESVARLFGGPRGSWMNWIEEDGVPRAAYLDEWGPWMENPKNRIVKQEDVGDLWVSTVFLGVVHSGGMLYETMIFAPHETTELLGKETTYRPEIDQERYLTREDALEGHAEMVEKAKRMFMEERAN